MSTRTALVTGIHGQDGRYMAEHLLSLSYAVIGLARPGDSRPAPAGVILHHGDLSQQRPIESLLRNVRPDEIYNFAALSSGSGMFDDPVTIGDINGLAVARLLEAIRAVDDVRIRLCQASSSEMFGEPIESPQSETASFRPRSPYGAAKLYAHSMISIYRKRHDVFACSAILFNHESPRRRREFVTRKVTCAAAAIKLGMTHVLELGNLDARRDWGFAGDTVRAMHLMLQQQTPDDYVVATGVTHSVRQLCETAFEHVGLDYRDHVREAPGDFRSNEQVQLVGDATFARQQLGWQPSLDFGALITSMVDHDLRQLTAKIETDKRMS
jgi:GDPmannose 4,6-dehydratase